jgi:hypothetical protein
VLANQGIAMKSSKSKTSIKGAAKPDVLAKGRNGKGAELSERDLKKVSGGTVRNLPKDKIVKT